MELLKYYLDNVDEDDCYFPFRAMIENGQQDSMFGFCTPVSTLFLQTPKEAIRVFKELIQPRDGYDFQDSCRFVLICHYLYKNNYYIEQFPELLSDPSELSDFAYNQVRSYLINERSADPARVTWQSRRDLINDLNFKVSNEFYIESELNHKFQIISTRGAEFHQMSNEEKLKEIANLIEYLLKDGKKFKVVDCEEKYYNFINNEQIMQFRKLIQCFRHSTKDNLNERKELSSSLEFLISYGLSILTPLDKK